MTGGELKDLSMNAIVAFGVAMGEVAAPVSAPAGRV